jgi:hypothetical protein
MRSCRHSTSFPPTKPPQPTHQHTKALSVSLPQKSAAYGFVPLDEVLPAAVGDVAGGCEVLGDLDLMRRDAVIQLGKQITRKVLSPSTQNNANG